MESAMKPATHDYAHGLVRYDADSRRVWVGGRRVHHGATGILLAAAGLALIAHDWRDRSSWFRFRPR